MNRKMFTLLLYLLGLSLTVRSLHAMELFIKERILWQKKKRSRDLIMNPGEHRAPPSKSVNSELSVKRFPFINPHPNSRSGCLIIRCNASP